MLLVFLIDNSGARIVTIVNMNKNSFMLGRLSDILICIYMYVLVSVFDPATATKGIACGHRHIFNKRQSLVRLSRGVVVPQHRP